MTGARPVVMAAGGTGGHMFPATAAAAALIARGHRVLLFTDRRGAEYGRRIEGLESIVVPSASPSRGGLVGKLLFGFTLLRGAWRARGLLRRHRAGAVVGFGGYASFPAGFMAGRMDLPLVLHEQNAYLGLANRKLARAARAIGTAFADVRGIPETAARIVRVGNPVRADIIALAGTPYRAPEAGGSLRLFVTGGSQGASVFSTVLPEAAARLHEEDRRRLEIVQQCRPADLERTRARYEQLGVAAMLASFFDDVPQQLADAHLMICRAGASTVAEVLTAGRPAIFVPYPHAADDHQSWNAREIVSAGAGWIMPQTEFTPEALADRLHALLHDPSPLVDVSASARAAAQPDAAEKLAALIESVLPASGPVEGAER